MTEHTLKTWKFYWDAVKVGDKTFDLRVNDRNFQVGDRLILRQWDPVGRCFTRHEDLRREVTYVLELKEYRDVKGWGWALARRLMPRLVILGISSTVELSMPRCTSQEQAQRMIRWI